MQTQFPARKQGEFLLKYGGDFSVVFSRADNFIYAGGKLFPVLRKRNAVSVFV